MDNEGKDDSDADEDDTDDEEVETDDNSGFILTLGLSAYSLLCL